MADRRSYVVREAPSTWKGLAQVVAGGLVEIAKALHRIADALEKTA